MSTVLTLSRQASSSTAITARAFNDSGTAIAAAAAASGTHPNFWITRASLGLTNTSTGRVVWYDDGTAIVEEELHPQLGAASEIAESTNKHRRELTPGGVYVVPRNASSVILRLFITDDAGEPITGLLHNSLGLTVRYRTQGTSAWSAGFLSAGTIGSWAAETITELGGGWYEYGLEDAAIIAGTITQLRVTLPGDENIYASIHSTAIDAVASEIASALDTQLSGSHGAGSWEGGVGAGGGGPIPLKVQLSDTAADPLSGFVVYLLDADGEPVNKWLPTDDDGEALFHLTAGIYQIAVASRVGYVTPAAVEVELIAAAVTQPITLSATTADPPALAGLCRVLLPTRGTTVAAEGAKWTAQLTAENQAIDNDLLTRVVTQAKAAADGSAELYLPQGKIYQVEGYHAGHRFVAIEYTVPATAEAYLADSL